jgi:predicted ATPase/class 3 adenylate cyclase
VPKVFLMTDVVGSTGLWEAHEPVMPAVLARHDDIVHGAVAAAGGRVFKHTGDGMIAAFDDAEPALIAAQAAGGGLATESWPIPGGIRIRTSLHSGPATERNDDFFGPALNRVARINGVAHPDQIVASDLVYRLLPDGAGVDLGEHQLRDLGERVRLWQLDEGEHPPLRSMRAELNNLPVQLTEFIGRRAEVEQLDRLLADHRLVTVSGMGGCGKTRIALEVAADASARYDGGTWLADLRSASDPDEIVQQVAAAIGLVGGGAAEGSGRLADLVVEYADRAPTLVVLDNCEHLVDDAADVADDLLRRSKSLTILATSREALGTDGERVWRIPSMGADSGEARELFLARATAASSDFAVGEDAVELVDRICAQLDGIPLAIELAAARVGHLSLAELEVGLDERFSLLSGGRRARRQRQQTLQAMMDWSWDLLDDDEQRMLTELAVFRGGFDVRGVDEVCAAPQVGSRFDVLTGLVDRSLVQVTADSGATSRYQLLETVRLYGLDRLTGAGMADSVRDRHAAWIRTHCSCLSPSLTWDPDDTLYWYRNVDNVLAAADWFARSGDVVAVAEVLSGRQGLFNGERNVDGIRWFTPAFVDDERLPFDVALAVTVAASQTAVFAGDYAAAGAFAQRGLSLVDVMDRHPVSEVTHFWAAQTCLFSGTLAVGADLDLARQMLARARALGGGFEDSPVVAVLVGLIALADRDFEAAVVATDLTFDDRLFEIPSLGVIRMVHAMALSWLGRHGEALVASTVAGVVGGIGMRTPNSVGTAQVAWVLLRAGRAQEALDLIARPSRLAIGAAVEQWRLGRALFLAEYVMEEDPELAVRLVGCVPQSATITLGLRRSDLLARVEGRTDRSIDELLQAGAAAGEDATVAEAHAIIRADGYTA